MKLAEIRRRSLSRDGLAVLAALSVAKFAFHIATHRGYGIFRDELYYLACAARLDWGYVDHPPLSIALLSLQTALLGDSLLALRLLPALAGAASVFAAGLVARELGGGWRAQAVAALAVFGAPYLLATSHFYSMNVFEWLLLSLLSLTAARILGRGAEREWLVFGVLAGLALLNKLLVLVYALGLLGGLLLDSERRQLARRWVWSGGGLAALLALPHLAWQIDHGWPTLEFIANARAGKVASLTPLEFLRDLALLVGPVSILLATLGLGALFAWPALRRWRALGWAFLLSAASFAGLGAKVYYLAPHFAVLLAAGAVALERWSIRPGRGIALLAASAGIAVTAAIALPAAVPVMPEPALVAWLERLGLQAPQTEKHAPAALPQLFADMHGWRELADRVTEIVRSLPEQERRGAVIFALNYGEAGAIERFGRGRDLPPVVSGHNSYWLWGAGGWKGGTLIGVGLGRAEAERWFHEVEDRGALGCRYCMPYENQARILVCRRPRLPVEELWQKARRFI